MERLFNITKIDSYKDDNRREVKKANDGLPNDMWKHILPVPNIWWTYHFRCERTR